MSDIDKKAHYHLLESAAMSHPKVYKLVRANGRLSLDRKPHQTLHEFLIRTIIGQQLSASAARAIWARTINVTREHGKEITSMSHGDFANCGISLAKQKAIEGLRTAANAGQLRENMFVGAEYGEIVEKVTLLKGLGPWSADMVAMFFVGLPDVWPATDGALSRGLQILLGRRIDRSVKLVEKYSPYRTYLARHVWKGLDDHVIQ